jgi:hypothetical protein
MAPVLLFKGKGNVSTDERQQYAKGVHVIFTSKAVINGPSMDTYIKKWLETVREHDLSAERERKRFPIQSVVAWFFIKNHHKNRIKNIITLKFHKHHNLSHEYYLSYR